MARGSEVRWRESCRTACCRWAGCHFGRRKWRTWTEQVWQLKVSEDRNLAQMSIWPVFFLGAKTPSGCLEVVPLEPEMQPLIASLELLVRSYTRAGPQKAREWQPFESRHIFSFVTLCFFFVVGLPSQSLSAAATSAIQIRRQPELRLIKEMEERRREGRGAAKERGREMEEDCKKRSVSK